MGSRGPQPSARREKAEHIGLKVPAEMKQQLIVVVNLRKAANPTLLLSCGLSEYIRELLAAHLAEVLGAAETKDAGERGTGASRTSAGNTPARRR
jgi:hypothetical protein